jgi:uncharacterized protein YjiS (DUF1127 family)
MIPQEPTASSWTAPRRRPSRFFRSLCDDTTWSRALLFRRRNSVGALSGHLLTDIGLASATTLRVGWRAIGP